MILYREKPKYSTWKLLELRMNSSRWQDTRLTYRNLLHFFILIKYQKGKVKKKNSFKIALKKTEV